MQEPKHPIIAHGKIRHVGEIVAAVVAESLTQARDAAEAIELGLTELPAVVNMKDALKGGATKVHDELTSNLCYDWGFVEENKDATDAAIKCAAHVTTLELVNNRLVANPMEPRVALGEYSRADDMHTLHTTSQNRAFKTRSRATGAVGKRKGIANLVVKQRTGVFLSPSSPLSSLSSSRSAARAAHGCGR